MYKALTAAPLAKEAPIASTEEATLGVDFIPLPNYKGSPFFPANLMSLQTPFPKQPTTIFALLYHFAQSILPDWALQASHD